MADNQIFQNVDRKDRRSENKRRSPIIRATIKEEDIELVDFSTPKGDRLPVCESAHPIIKKGKATKMAGSI